MNKIFLPVLLVMLFIVCTGAEAADWTLLGKTNLGTVYYDKYGIEQLSGNIIRVLVKNVYSSEGVKEFRGAFRQIDSSETISYEDAPVNC